MTHDQQQADAIGMQEAAAKHGVDLQAYYQGRDYKEVVPYTPPVQNTAIAPINYAQVAKSVGLLTSVCVVGYVGAMAVKIAVYAVLVWVEANALAIGGIFVGGCAFIVLLASTKGSGESSQSSSYGGQSGKITINNYYQSNSFGGNANQDNK